MTSLAVIIPAYDAAAFVDSALGSIAAQSVQPDEIIVVDDGSTDETVERVRRWEALLPVRAHVLEENIGAGLGAGGARAIGIEQSTADLVALLDVDDFWYPDHLEVMIAAHERAGGLITANHRYWVPGQQVGALPASELIPVPPPAEQVNAILSENFVFVSTLFSRRLYDSVGPMRNIRCEDWDLWIRMVDSGARVTMPDQVTALYRQTTSSVSGEDKLLIGDIDLLNEHRIGRNEEQVAVIDRAIQRREAKRLFLDGVALAESGRIRQARAAWMRSIKADPSLRTNNSNMNGRVAVRSLACMVAPRSMVRMRSKRQADPEVTVGS